MSLKHCKYCIRMRSPMLAKRSILGQFWSPFGTLVGHFWHRSSSKGCPCRGLENHAILRSGLGQPRFEATWSGEGKMSVPGGSRNQPYGQKT